MDYLQPVPEQGATSTSGRHATGIASCGRGLRQCGWHLDEDVLPVCVCVCVCACVCACVSACVCCDSVPFSLQLIPPLIYLVQQPDREIKTDACWAFAFIADSTQEMVQLVVNANIIPFIVTLLYTQENRVIVSDAALHIHTNAHKYSMGCCLCGTSCLWLEGPSANISIHEN